jgi:hypothetical protein
MRNSPDGSLNLSGGVFAPYIKFISYFIEEDGLSYPINESSGRAVASVR